MWLLTFKIYFKLCVGWVKNFNIEIGLGSVKKPKAIYQMESIYFREPDSNIIEVAIHVK